MDEVWDGETSYPMSDTMARRLLCMLALLLAGCSKPLPPPPSPPGPTVQFEKVPRKDQVLDTASVSFAWKGSDKWVSEFSYCLHGETWSDWTRQTSVDLVLDEGDYTFRLKGRYPEEEGGRESEEITRKFTVDAIQGPALWLKPRHTTVQVRDTVTVWVWAEDMADLMLAHLEIAFDETRLHWLDPMAGSFLSRNNAQVISFFPEAGEIQGHGIIDLGAAGGSPHGVNGSGPLVALRFEALGQGTVRVSTDSVEVRNSANVSLKLNAWKFSSTVVIN